MGEGQLYFAYGSNLSRSQMAHRCPGASPVGVALLADHRIGFTRWSDNREGGVADAVPSPGDVVWGLLYGVTPGDRDALDKCEGHPSAYRRSLKTVERADGAAATAWVYTVVDKRDFVPPAPEYLELITEEAGRLGFPDDYVGVLRGFAHPPP